MRGTIPWAEIGSEQKGKEGGAVKLFLERHAFVSLLPDCLGFCFLFFKTPCCHDKTS